MLRQRILWTALPAGVEDGRLRLTVFLSPQLWSDQNAVLLSAYADLAAWPTTLQTVKLTVHFDQGPTVAPGEVKWLSTPDPKVWSLLFPSDVRVEPYQYPNHHTRVIRSFPLAALAQFLEDTYATVGVQADEDPPTVDSNLLTSLLPLAPEAMARTAGVGIRGDGGQTPGIVPPGGSAIPPTAHDVFLAVAHFHAPTLATRVPMTLPKFDFHQAVAALGQHPSLLRAAGLAIDMLLPLGPGDVPATSTVWVEAAWAPQTPTDNGPENHPRTHYQVIELPAASGAKTFLAAPHGGPSTLDRGMLRLEPPLHELVQFDPDGAAEKVSGTAGTVRRLRQLQRTTQRAALPSLRSGGLILVRTGRASELQARLTRMHDQRTGLQANTPPDLWADDLVRGYRVDVFDATTQRWRSLCQRLGKYTFAGSAGSLTSEEEGWVALAAAGTPNDPTSDLKLHEALCCWTGWSLAAARPGSPLGSDGQPTTPANEPVPPFKLTASYEAAEKSLPTLRFGREYRLRARAVDLAGNGLRFVADVELPHATAATTYRRFEPVPFPALVPRHSLAKQPAEKVDYLVVRSTPNQAAAAYAQANGYVPSAERHVVPPQISVELAEAHGLFDSPNSGPAPTAYALITGRQGALPENEGAATIALPYLPDPFARGAALRGLPGVNAAEVVQVSFENTAGSWPSPQPFRVVLEEGDFTAPAWDAARRAMTVRLPKAEWRTVRLSCSLAPADLDFLAIWDWLQRHGGAGLKVKATEGRHWMLTPYREVVLLHAVREPLEKPGFSQLLPSRSVGATDVQLRVIAETHAKSTGKVDLVADWQEPVDNPAESAPRTIASGQALHRRQAVHEESITAPAETAPSGVGEQLLHDVRHEFGDTKFREVNYHLVATTRFREFFHLDEAKIADGTTPISTVGEPQAVDILSSARPAAPDVHYVVPTFRWERGQEGAGRFSRRHGGGLRVYLGRPWFSSGDGELLGVVLRSPTSSASAPAQQALSVYLTQWGADPLFQSSSLPASYPAADVFATQVAQDDQLGLQEVPGPTVAAVGHPVGFDDQRHLWYCDLEIDAGDAYYPFIRLVLARFQPKSLNRKLMLSRTVRADFAQLVPDRFAVLQPAGGGAVSVSVGGPQYSATQHDQRGSVMEAVVERQVGEGDLGWAAVGEPLSLGLNLRRGSSGWTGQVPLPSGAGGPAWRVVLREYELLPTGELPTFSRIPPRFPNVPESSTGSGGRVREREPAASGAPSEAPGTLRRLVYAEALPL